MSNASQKSLLTHMLPHQFLNICQLSSKVFCMLNNLQIAYNLDMENC